MRIASSEPLIVPDIKEVKFISLAYNSKIRSQNNFQVPNQNIDYDACGKTQTCFGLPSGCTSEKNCHTAVTITYTTPTYKFQMVTSSGIIES